MQRSYHILGRSDSRSSRKLAAYLARHGQFLLPWVELIEQSRLAVDELIDVVGRAAIEAVLEFVGRAGGRSTPSGPAAPWGGLVWAPAGDGCA